MRSVFGTMQKCCVCNIDFCDGFCCNSVLEAACKGIVLIKWS